jgi:hypothetical protein
VTGNTAYHIVVVSGAVARLSEDWRIKPSWYLVVTE